MDQQVADIFTKPLTSDCIFRFFLAYNTTCWAQGGDEVRKVETDVELDFETTEEAEDGWTNVDRMEKWRLVKCRGSDHKGKSELEPTEKGGGKAKKGKGDVKDQQL